MSDYVRYKGELCMVDVDDLENWCRLLLESRDVDSSKIPSWFNSYAEYLADEFYDEYVLVNNNLYEIVKRKKLDSEFDFFNGKVLENGNIEFETMYYNGGCGFSEAMEIVVDSLEGNNGY